MSKVVNYKDNTSGSGTSIVTTKYTYDGAGNRVNSKVELNGSVTSNTTYVVDGESSYNDIIMAKDSISEKTSIFTFPDEVISVETSGNISYYRTDEKNSVTDSLDTTGKVKATIEYDEYGVIANPEVVSTGGNIFAYTGHVYEESTGLYYAKARYYYAGIGRFVSEDSYRGEQDELLSLNHYIYGMNNPLKYTDPSGNMNYFTQTDELLKGVRHGVASWIWDIIGKSKKIGNGNKKAKSIPKTTKAKEPSKVSEPACFVAGTQIITIDGRINIEDIQTGDYVLAENPETGETDYKEVVRTFVRYKDATIHVIVNGTEIETTREHPFWVEGKGFVKAGYLLRGDILRLSSGQKQ